MRRATTDTSIPVEFLNAWFQLSYGLFGVVVEAGLAVACAGESVSGIWAVALRSSAAAFNNSGTIRFAGREGSAAPDKSSTERAFTRWDNVARSESASGVDEGLGGKPAPSRISLCVASAASSL